MSAKRFYAEVFDADGKFYVFDAEDGGAECAGPFDTLGEAEREADRLNKEARG